MNFLQFFPVFRIQIHWVWIRIQHVQLQEKPSALKKEHAALQNMKFLNFFAIFGGHFAPPGSGSPDLIDPKRCLNKNIFVGHLWLFGSRIKINADPDSQHRPDANLKMLNHCRSWAASHRWKTWVSRQTRSVLWAPWRLTQKSWHRLLPSSSPSRFTS
jgi:hypothetical protein